MPEMTPDFLVMGILWIAVFLFSATVHEAAHALVAWKLGDPTAYNSGQVTLNPMPHIQREPVGTILVPIVSYAMMGWAIGWASAPYDPWWADRYPKRAAWMAAAGPAANLIVATLAGLAIRGGMIAGVLEAPPTVRSFSELVIATDASSMFGGAATFLSLLFFLNLLLFLFNLIPVPPLDGSAILPLVMSDQMARNYLDFMRQPTFSLLGILVAWKILGEIPLLSLALNLLYPELGYS